MRTKLQQDRIAAFLTIGSEELEAARQIHQNLPRQGLYFLQQATEKHLRAVLEAAGIAAGATHDLVALAVLLPKDHPMRSIFVQFDDLSNAATRLRYPGSTGRLTVVKAEHVAARLKDVERLVTTVQTFLADDR